MVERELMPLIEASKLLGVGRSTIVHLIERGDLEVYRVPSAQGKRLDRYVERAAVERLKQEGWRRRGMG
jgi:excisionase family DNA binding protein